jgi:hypothetical protein
MSNSSEALEITDRHRVYEVIIAGMKKICEWQLRHGEVVGMHRPMIIEYVRAQLGDLVAHNAPARLTELANMGVVRKQGSRKNTQSGSWCGNYVYTGKPITEYVPVNTRYKLALKEALEALKQPTPGKNDDLIARIESLFDIR